MSQTATDKKPISWMRLALIVIVVSFFTGFLIGLGGHRDGKQIAEFVSAYTKSELSDGSAMLTFQCGSNQKLVAYDLLSDEILLNRDAIEARLHNPLFKFTQNELFGAAAGFATSSLGVVYSFNDEIGLIAAGESSLRRAALVFMLAIPTAYIGYSASDYFKLECNSNKLYEYLYKAENWKPHQFYALKALYESTEPCVPRRVSVGDFFPAISNTKLNDWLELIYEPMDGFKPVDGLTEDEKAALLGKLSAGMRSRFGQLHIDVTRALWGDSIFLRLFGVGGFTEVDTKIDGADFRALLKQARACHQRVEELRSQGGSGNEDVVAILYRRAKHEQSGVDISTEGAFGRRWLKIAENTAAMR
jgi:hypothetical protein